MVSYNFDHLKIASINMDRATKYAMSSSFVVGLAASAIFGGLVAILNIVLGVIALLIGASVSFLGEKRSLCKFFVEKYYPHMKGGETSSYELAMMTKRDEEKVKADLEKLIRWGIITVAPESINKSAARLIPITAEGDTRSNMRENRSDKVKAFDRETEAIMKRVNEALKGVSDQAMRLRVDNLAEVLQAVSENVHRDETFLGFADRVNTYYLPTLEKLVTAFRDLEAMPAAGPSTEETKERIRGAVVTLSLGFGEMLKRMMDQRKDDISSEITVLEQILSMDGLREDDLKAFRNAVAQTGKGADDGLQLDAIPPASRESLIAQVQQGGQTQSAQSAQSTQAADNGPAALADDGLNEIERLINQRLQDIEDHAQAQANTPQSMPMN